MLPSGENTIHFDIKDIPLLPTISDVIKKFFFPTL